jgi:hypothetical protein
MAMSACGGGDDESESSLTTEPSEISQAVFSGDQIDPTKWSPGSLHFVRKVENGVFVSEIARRGSDGSNTVSFSDPFEGIDYGSSIPPTSFQAEVTVKEAKNKGAQVRALIQGRFYKDTNAPGRTGEIIANIDIRQEEDSTELIVVVFVLRCLNANCTNSGNLYLPPNPFGTVELKSRHTLSIDFDGRRTFTFGFDNRPPLVFSQTPAPAVVAPSEDPLRFYGTSVSRINENAQPPEEGFIAATFEHLVVNGRPYEDPKDDRRFRSVRRVANGMLELEVAGIGASNRSDVQNSLFIAYPESVNAFRADVTLLAFGMTGTTLPKARIVGAWFNTGQNPNPVSDDDRTGDIIAEIILLANEENAIARLIRCDDKDCSKFTDLESFKDETPFGPVKLNVPYRLSIAFDRTTFSFGFNGETKRVPPDKMPPIVGPAHSPFRALLTGVFDLAPGEDALVVARFDNVFVDRIPYDDFSPINNPMGLRPASPAENFNQTPGSNPSNEERK